MPDGARLSRVHDRPTVLLVERFGSRSSTYRDLAARNDIVVRHVGSVRAALEELDRRPPKLVISDIDLPDGTGLDIIDEVERRGTPTWGALLAKFSPRYWPVACECGVLLHEKPLPSGRLQQALQTWLGASEAPGFAPLDFLMAACVSRQRAVSVECRDEAGYVVGHISLRGGHVVFAEDARGVGPDALHRLLFDDSLRPRYVGKHAWSTTRMTALDGWTEVVREVGRARRKPRRNRPQPIQPPPTVELPPVPVVTFPAGARRRPETLVVPMDELAGMGFQALYDAGVDAILRRDFGAARAALGAAAAIDPTHRSLQANIRRLAELGYDV